MCGINGIINPNLTLSELKHTINAMNAAILHRGPDEDGVYIDEKNNVAMGMRRLSIIDLNTGSQPQYNEDQSIVIVFNGEIYNFLILKEELKQKNVNFKTQSDTEVILKIYETYGIEGFKKLDGMFAFALLDQSKQKVFIARDFFGEKPLYYTHKDNQFLWASELKSIRTYVAESEIDLQALQLYFQLTYIPAPYTIYQNIKKLEANSLLTFDLKTNNISIDKIHSIEKPKKIDISFSEAKSEVERLLEESVSSRSIADVPLGTFLSGGVDSSVISLLLSKQRRTPINTFSIGFKKKSFDESDKARTVAKVIGSHHNEFILDEKDLEEEIDKVLFNFDEPFADSSSLASYIVSREARKHMKVALTGDGGDEVFGGYNKYLMGYYNRIFTKWTPQRAHSLLLFLSEKIKNKNDDRGLRFKVNKALQAFTYDNSYYENIISLGFHKNELSNLFVFVNGLENLIKNRISKIDLSTSFSLSDYRMIDQILSLEGDMLAKVDRTSMLASIETRAPFLNRELWNFTMQLPENYLLNGRNKKYLLKKTFETYFPPQFLEKSKQGFGVPVGDWLRSSLKAELLSFIEPNFISKQNIFNPEFISKIVNEHITGKKDNTFKVWTYYVFQKWYKKNS